MFRSYPRIFTALGALLSALLALAQQNDIPLNRDIYYDLDRNGAEKSSTMHTGMRPIIQSRADLHNVMGFRPDSSHQYYWITQKLIKEHLINVKDGGFKMTIDPVLQFELGQEFQENDLFTNELFLSHNGRGFQLAVDLGPTVSFQSSFYENQAVLPAYLYRYAQIQGVVPGQGRIKTFNSRGLDFAWATGNVSWSPRPWFNAQLGQGRHFVGNGYRSVLLSDNASPYPYVKFSALTTNKRFQYTTIFAKLQLVGEANRLPTGEASESLFYWKRASFQYLSVNLGPVQLGLFEGTLWKTIDTSGVRPFNAMQMNPVIGVNTIVNGFDGSNTQVLGVDAKYKVTDKMFAYGQFALTDPGRSRYAWQVGMQWFDLFRKDLHLLAEFNQATPYAYVRNEARMSWTHNNQPLASPLGTSYAEAVLRVDYGIRQKIWFQGELSMEQHPFASGIEDVPGSTIFGPDMPIGTTGKQQQRLYAGLNVSWRMNQMTNMQLTLGYSMRDLQPARTDRNSGVLYIAWHTGLFNRYYDI